MNSARHRVCIVPLNPLFIRLFWVSKTYRMFAIRYTGGEGETRTHTPFPATNSLANCFLTIRITSPYGCGGWTRTNGRTGRLLRESKSRALPTWRHRNIVERIKGFEPSQPAWKAGMLTVKHHILIFFITEPKDFHLWEQWLGSCLQPLPAVFPLLATNILIILHCYFIFPCF